MKKCFLCFTGSTILLAACGTNNNDQAKVKALIDSTVNARVAAHDAENARKNDSIINEAAKIKAQAMNKDLVLPKDTTSAKKPIASPAPMHTPPVQK